MTGSSNAVLAYSSDDLSSGALFRYNALLGGAPNCQSCRSKSWFCGLGFLSLLYTHTNTHTHTHTHTNTQKHTNTQTNTQTHKHTHTNTRPKQPSITLFFSFRPSQRLARVWNAAKTRLVRCRTVVRSASVSRTAKVCRRPAFAAATAKLTAITARSFNTTVTSENECGLITTENAEVSFCFGAEFISQIVLFLVSLPQHFFLFLFLFISFSLVFSLTFSLFFLQ